MYEASPSATDPRELVPPIFTLPTSTPQVNAIFITFHQKCQRSTVIKDIKKGIIVEDVDAYASSIGASLCHKRMSMNIIEGQPIPRPDYSNMHAVDVEKGQYIDEDTIEEGYWGAEGCPDDGKDSFRADE